MVGNGKSSVTGLRYGEILSYNHWRPCQTWNANAASTGHAGLSASVKLYAVPAAHQTRSYATNMQGLHLTGDLSGCRCAMALLVNPDVLEQRCLALVADVGLAQVNRLFHAFAPDVRDTAPASGVTGVVLLAESHLAVHTWPEMAGVTLDVYVCNYGQDNSGKARALFDALCALFEPASVHSQALERGRPS